MCGQSGDGETRTQAAWSSWKMGHRTDAKAGLARDFIGWRKGASVAKKRRAIVVGDIHEGRRRIW